MEMAEVQEKKWKYEILFQASAYVISANILLLKASHLTGSRISVGGLQGYMVKDVDS